MKIALAYDSLSGNTKMVANIINDALSQAHDVTCFRVAPGSSYPLQRIYDLYVLGTWTVDYGKTPADMKDFIAELGTKPKHVAVFGTGETQWGLQYYCGAVDRVATYFNSSYPTLKIEQMPHTSADEEKIKTWAEAILKMRSEER